MVLYFKEETSLGDETAILWWNSGNEIPSDAVYFSQKMDTSNITLYVIRGHLKEGQSVSSFHDSMLLCTNFI